MDATARKIDLADPPRFRLEDSAKLDKQALMSEIIRLRAYVKELERAADSDTLTPVYNRRAFLRELSRAQSVYQRYEIPTTLIFLDLDGFKAVNDRFGHVIGDELLYDVGNVLQKNVRDCDLVARLGGDEFGILLFKTELSVAQRKAEQLAGELSAIEVSIPTSSTFISVSWGCAPVRNGMTPERIISIADERMYRCKRLKKTSEKAAS